MNLHRPTLHLASLRVVRRKPALLGSRKIFVLARSDAEDDSLPARNFTRTAQHDDNRVAGQQRRQEAKHAGDTTRTVRRPVRRRYQFGFKYDHAWNKAHEDVAD